MASVPQALTPLTSIKLPGRRMRQLASKLHEIHTKKIVEPPECPVPPILVVCISDTHNTRPALPPGDVLIHAGDLTENGSFDEVQAGLTWLSSQPYRYKILIAGNHDVLLDNAFLERYPERRYGQAKTREDLVWGSVLYLQDKVVLLDFPSSISQASELDVGPKAARKLTVFGSPWTPQYGISAFQYRPDYVSHWRTRFSGLQMVKPDIVVTHGPPKHHLDARDFYRAGCPYLAEEISQLRPQLVVFGHIHASYGREDVVLDGVQRIYEEAMTGWAGWGKIVWMAILVLWARLTRGVLGRLGSRGDRQTTFVNASIVGGPRHELRNEPIVVEL